VGRPPSVKRIIWLSYDSLLLSKKQTFYKGISRFESKSYYKSGISVKLILEKIEVLYSTVYEFPAKSSPRPYASSGASLDF
jgi:hypothetical protein